MSWPETEATKWVVSTQTRKRGKIRRRLKEVVLERQRTSEQYTQFID